MDKSGKFMQGKPPGNFPRIQLKPVATSEVVGSELFPAEKGGESKVIGQHFARLKRRDSGGVPEWKALTHSTASM
jgi:hypothetical protein